MQSYYGAAFLHCVPNNISLGAQPTVCNAILWRANLLHVENLITYTIRIRNVLPSFFLTLRHKCSTQAELIQGLYTKTKV